MQTVVQGTSHELLHARRSLRLGMLHKCQGRHAGHEKPVLCVAQHPTSPNTAVSCGEDRVVRLWSLQDGICRRTIACRSKPLCVAFSREGDFIASAHFDGSLHIFDAASGKDMKHFDKLHLKECVAVVPTQHASRVLSVGKDDAICISDAYRPEVRCTDSCGSLHC